MKNFLHFISFNLFRKRSPATITAFELERDILSEAYKTYLSTLDVMDFVPAKVLKADHKSIAKIKRKTHKKLTKKYRRDIGFYGLPVQDENCKKLANEINTNEMQVGLVKSQTKLALSNHEHVETLRKIELTNQKQLPHNTDTK